MPVIKDARLFAHLSSAPGTNRIKLKSIANGHQHPMFNQEQNLGMTSQGLPTASAKEGEPRAMNSAQGERVRFSKKQSEIATQPGANDDHIQVNYNL